MPQRSDLGERTAGTLSFTRTAPALARVLRDRIAKTVTPAVGRHAAFLASERKRIRKTVADPVRRREIFERLKG